MVLLKHVSQKPLSLHSICIVAIPVDADVHLGKSHEYMQLHAQYSYIIMLLYFSIALTELQLRLLTSLGAVCYGENAYLLSHRSEHMCVSAVYYPMDSVTKALHCKEKQAISLNWILHS